MLFRDLGLRRTLEGIRMCLLFNAVRRVHVTALRMIASGPEDRLTLWNLLGVALLKQLPEAYLFLFRLLIGRGEWVLNYAQLLPFTAGEELEE